MAQALLDAEKAEAIIAKLRADKLLLVAQLAAMRTRAEEAEAALRAGGMGMGMRERAERAEATCITLQEELDARPPRAADGCSLCCGPDRNVLVIDRRELLSLTLTLTPTPTLTPTRYELGGRGKYTTALVFVGFWVLFITLSSIYLMHDIAIF